MSTTHIVVLGVEGRMGMQIATAAIDDDRHSLVGATVRPQSKNRGVDVGTILHRDNLSIEAFGTIEGALANASDDTVVIDFTQPHLTASHATQAALAGVPYLVGTTGLKEEAFAALHAAAKKIPVLLAPNTSLGAHVLRYAVSLVSKALEHADVEVDHEIVELHHRMKKDAPSGTALMLGQAIAATGHTHFEERCITSRSGDALRAKNEIGIFGVRGGTVPGEHTAYFFLDDERLELTHRVSDRNVFAIGALTAARFLKRKPAGSYSMNHVLGIDS